MAAEGQLQHNGRFKITALGMPPNERREESLVAAKVSLWSSTADQRSIQNQFAVLRCKRGGPLKDGGEGSDASHHFSLREIADESLLDHVCVRCATLGSPAQNQDAA